MVQVQVTVDDIKNGIAQLGGLCPVALALSRVSRTPMHVTRSSVTRAPFHQNFRHVRLPKVAQEFVAKFDDSAEYERQLLQPFEFEIDLTPLETK